MADCKEITERLLDWIEGEASGAEQARIAGHLESCANCAAEAKELQTLFRSVARLPELVPPKGVEARVMARVRRSGETTVRSKRPVPPSGPAGWWAAFGARRLMAGAALAAVLLVVVVGAGLSERGAGPAQMASVPSGVRLEIAAGQATLEGSTPAASGTQLLEGGLLEVSADFKGKLVYPDGTVVKVRSGAAVRVFSHSLGLREGKVWLNVKKGGSGFRVETPQAVVAVRGTVFGVDCDGGSQRTHVVVEEGSVEVRTPQDSVVLEAGQAAEATATIRTLNREDFEAVFGLDREDFIGKPKQEKGTGR